MNASPSASSFVHNGDGYSAWIQTGEDRSRLAAPLFTPDPDWNVGQSSPSSPVFMMGISCNQWRVDPYAIGRRLAELTQNLTPSVLLPLRSTPPQSPSIGEL